MRLFTVLALLGAPVSAHEITSATLDQLPEADVIVLGEVHDNPLHHIHQARAIDAIGPSAVVWEMLTAAQAAQMPEDRRDAALVAAALGWEGTGWPEFTQYFPIVQAADWAQHFGAAVPREAARRAFSDGAAAVFEGDAARYGLTVALPFEEQAAREVMQFEAHCQAMPHEMMGGLVEAQRLRDANLARAVVSAFEATGGPVVVITGNGHAHREWGVPAVLQTAAPELRVLSIGQVEEVSPENASWDLWLVTAPYPREDPCAAFQ